MEDTLSKREMPDIHEFEELMSDSDSSNQLHGRTRILRASEVLLSIAGQDQDDEKNKEKGKDSPTGVETYQDVLRVVPAEGADVRCPDCPAVFSSSTDLEGHYLTKYCPGSAVAVYVMTRDRLITKGYRMEKRYVAFDCRPVRFYCSKCEKPFTMNETERLRCPSLVQCKHCGATRNVAYEPVIKDPRDSTISTTPMDLASPSPSVAPSIAPSVTPRAKLPAPEQSFTRRLRDSWSTRKLSQADEEELLAISFAGLYDLERVHAPNGTFQSLDTAGNTMSVPDGVLIGGYKRSALTLCEDPGEHQPVTQPPKKRQSFIQKLFTRKEKDPRKSRRSRFSFMSKTKLESPKAEPEQSEHSQSEDPESKDDLTGLPAPDAENVALLRSSQNVFVHMQYLSGTAIVHDASNRQRILHMEEVARLFLQLRDELAATPTWSRALTTRMRADATLKQGDLKTAVLEYLDALTLQGTSASVLDVNRLARAAALHGLGKAYRDLRMPLEAQTCLLESLSLYKRALGCEDPRTFDVVHDLGILYDRDGCVAEAAALYERSFNGRRKALGHNAPETLHSMQNLATAKISLGKLETALVLLEDGVPALETVFGPNNANSLEATNKLSYVCEKLGLEDEAHVLCARAIPASKAVFGVFHPTTRDLTVRFVQCATNFDFPSEVTDILDQYSRSKHPETLKVIHRVGRAYMSEGLNRDAAELFEALLKDCLAVCGPDSSDTFDVLSALCVSREHLGSIGKAIQAYQQLVHMARRTPHKSHNLNSKIDYAEKRIKDLHKRRDLLAFERKEWGLGEPAPCSVCGVPTRIICNTCKITRFCSEACHSDNHPACIPSVSLHESKSLNVRGRCPASVQAEALASIVPAEPSVQASYTFFLDPRNFTTFRMKLNPAANTLVVFSRESDVRYSLITGGSGGPCAEGEKREDPQWTLAKDTVKPVASGPGEDRYLLVAPGKAMLDAMVDRRVRVRESDGDRFRGLELPSMELIEFAQGLLSTGNLKEAFMYVIEWT